MWAVAAVTSLSRADRDVLHQLLLLLLFASWRSSTAITFTPSRGTGSREHFHGQKGFVAGASLRLLLLGWDVTANLNEETRMRRRPRTGAMIGISLCSFSSKYYDRDDMSSLAPDHNTRRLLSCSSAVCMRAGSSSCWQSFCDRSDLETTLIQVTRTMFAMGRDHTLPKALGTVHPSARPTRPTAVVTSFRFCFLDRSPSIVDQ